MADSTAAPARRSHHGLRIAAISFGVLVLALVLLVMFFPWDLLRGPLNRYVSEKTGRHFAITRKLDVKLGRTTRVIADGIEFANPSWARDPYLVRAEGAEVEVNLLPLLHRRIELPLVSLHKPQLGLQVEPDGRRTWAFGKDTKDKRNVPVIGSMVIDNGALHFVAAEHGADIRAEFGLEKSAFGGQPGAARDAGKADNLPLSFRAEGQWKQQPFKAEGRGGNVMQLNGPLPQPFPATFKVNAGRTSLQAEGTVASLATMDGLNVNVLMQGQNLADLYHLAGVVLPETPRYNVRLHLDKQGEVWHATQINGKLGNSDLEGQLDFDASKDVPLLTGNVKSKALDFDDLAPLVGLPEQPRSAAAQPGAGSVPVQAKAPAAKRDPAHKVLPTATLDTKRLKAMNADVRYAAARITHVREIPLERASVHVVMQGGVLDLQQLDLGVAGGRIAGRMRFDGNKEPALAQAKLDVRSLELARLFPGTKFARASFGKIHGDIDLTGRGNSAATMLGTSSGNVALLMGQGQISNLIMELVGLDIGEALKFYFEGDQQIGIRCAAAAFDVNKGLMSSRALMFDTTDTVVYGDGRLSLAQESMDMVFRPYPKDKSILALRSPLRVGGTFFAPKAGVDKGALAARAGAALALGAINPLLALAATVETGPGKDANCGAVLREAAAPAAEARAEASIPAGGTGTQAMGAGAQDKPKGGIAGFFGKLRGQLGGPARSRPGADYPLDPQPAVPAR
jgi:uncharacterized protein involved in outer membrane biogenesis